VRFAKNPINRPFLAKFSRNPSFHLNTHQKGKENLKNLGKTSFREVRKRKSDSFAKFAKESDECRKSISRSLVSVANGSLCVANGSMNVANGFLGVAGASNYI
jgi:hypothetical protein